MLFLIVQIITPRILPNVWKTALHCRYLRLKLYVLEGMQSNNCPKVDYNRARWPLRDWWRLFRSSQRLLPEHWFPKAAVISGQEPFFLERTFVILALSTCFTTSSPSLFQLSLLAVPALLALVSGRAADDGTLLALNPTLQYHIQTDQARRRQYQTLKSIKLVRIVGCLLNSKCYFIWLFFLFCLRDLL